MSCRFPDCPTQKTQRFGLCNKHRKWVEKGYYSEDLVQLKPMKKVRLHCKLEGCKNKHKAKGFCIFHYRQFKGGIIAITGQRLKRVRPKKYPKDFGCIVCNKKGKISLGFCKTHHAQYSRGIIDFDGVKIREHKKVYKYPEWQVCKANGCNERPRVRGWCSNHYESFTKGIYDKSGKRLVAKLISNKGKKCSAESCEAEAYCKGLCKLHYSRKKIGYLGPAGYKNIGQKCSDPGCENPAHCRTLCVLHYHRWKRVNLKGTDKSGYL